VCALCLFSAVEMFYRVEASVSDPYSLKPDPDLATNLNPDPKSLKSYPDSAQNLNPDLAPNPDSCFFLNSLKKTEIGLKLQVRSWWAWCVPIAGCCVAVPLPSRLTLPAVRVAAMKAIDSNVTSKLLGHLKKHSSHFAFALRLIEVCF